tara:strand:+ start:11066 stop:11857 length:792 start_codon:yes stop_codon:yes gene_type:complete
MNNIHPMDESLAKHGRLGDSEIRNVKGEPSHVNPLEALIIDMQGKKGENIVSNMGSGTINPKTGMREYVIDPFTIGVMLLHAVAAWKIASGKDWKPWTKQWGDKNTATTKAMAGGVSSFADLKDLYAGKGRFKDVTNIGKAIQGLRYHRGGYGGQELSDWSGLGGGEGAFRSFNPLKALSEKLSPFIQKLTKSKRQSLGKSTDKLADLSKSIDVGGVGLGQTKDLFKMGANVQGEAERMMQTDVAQESGIQQESILSDWLSTV